MLPFVEDALSVEPQGASLRGLSIAARKRLRFRPLAWGESGSSDEASQSNLSQLCDFGGPIDLIIGADLVFDGFPVQALQKTLMAALRSHKGIAVLALQPRRFPQAAYLRDPQRISAFLKSFNGQEEGWQLRVDRPTPEAVAQLGKEGVENVVIATITPPSSQAIEHSASRDHHITYSQEEL